MTHIILVRHGHVEGIDPPRFRGRIDLPLTETGRRQAWQTAQRIGLRWKPTALYTSPMGRCVATGQAIADATGLHGQVLEELDDLDYGAWQGRAYDEIRTESPRLFELWFTAPHLVRFPQGDALQDLVVRAANAVRLVAERHPKEVVVMVGHDSVNRAILLQLIDQPLSAYWRLRQDPCAISEIEIAEGSVCVRCINATEHLDAPS